MNTLEVKKTIVWLQATLKSASKERERASAREVFWDVFILALISSMVERQSRRVFYHQKFSTFAAQAAAAVLSASPTTTIPAHFPL